MGSTDSIKKAAPLPNLVPPEYCKAHFHNVHDICYVLGVDPETVIMRPCRDMADQAAMYHTDVDSLLLAKGCAACSFRWSVGADTSSGNWGMSKGAKGAKRPPRKDHFAALKASASGEMRTQIVNSQSEKISFVLPKIEMKSGVTIPAGWKGDVDAMAAHVRLPVEDVSKLWRESVEDLRAMGEFHISAPPAAKARAKPRR